MKSKSRTILLTLILLGGSSCDSQEPAVPDEPEKLQELWRTTYQINGATSVQPTVVGDSLVVFSNTNTLTALRISDGSVKWDTPPHKNRVQLQAMQLLYDQEHLYGGHIDNLHAWKLATGEQAWTYEPGAAGRYNSFVYGTQDANTLYGSRNVGTVQRIDKATGDVLYERQLHSIPRGITLYENEIYLAQAWPENSTGLIHGSVQKLSASLDTTLWTFSTDQGGFWRNRPLVENGIVFAGSVGNSTSGSVFVALDAQAGEPVWQQPGVHTFTWTHGPRYLYINDSRDLVALDKANGSIVWRTPLQAGSGEAHVAYMDGYVYHPHGAALFVLDGETGEIVHAEVPEDGTYYWEVGVGAGKVFTWTSRHFLALEPYQPD